MTMFYVDLAAKCNIKYYAYYVNRLMNTDRVNISRMRLLVLYFVIGHTSVIQYYIGRYIYTI